MRRTLTTLALVLAAATTAVLPASASTESRTYIAGPGDLTSANCFSNTGAPGTPAVGGACFLVPAGATSVDITIDDAHGMPVAGQVYFRNATANIPHSYGSLCGDREDYPIPAGALRITVYVPTALANEQCALRAHAGTTGTVTVNFS